MINENDPPVKYVREECQVAREVDPAWLVTEAAGAVALLSALLDRRGVVLDGFNAFNHAQFNNPVSNVANPNFGRVISARTAREIQFALKLLW